MRVSLPLAIALLLFATASAGADSKGRYQPAALEKSLGQYETLAVAQALEIEKATVVAEPDGLRVGRIRVVNLDVFSKRDGFLQALNRLHVTTKPYIIDQEVLVRPGQLWDQTRIDETSRNLEIPEYSSLVVILPVQSDAPGMVDILVVTRDVWSLRTSSKFEIQNATLVSLLMFPAELNTLGRRKQVSARFELDLGSVSIGPRYVDPNIAGTHLRFNGFAQAVFSRKGSDFEGQRAEATLEMPLWSLEKKWGYSLAFDAGSLIDRTFRGTEVVLHPDPDRVDADPNEERAPREFRLRTFRLAAEGVRSLGTSFKHRFSGGYAITVRRPELLDSFIGSAELADLFADEVLGRSERLAGPVVRYEGFEPRFTTYMNVDTLDLVEDVRLGPTVLVELSPTLEALGSEINLMRGRTQLGWAVGDELGLARVSVGGGVRTGKGGVSGADVNASFFAASPLLGRAGRVVVSGRLESLLENVEDEVLLAGAQNGLRGFDIGEFGGDARVLLNAELRTTPVALKALRLAGVAFWDAGHAAASLGAIQFQHDIGIGLRAVLPQDTKFVNRIDWAFPLTGSGRGFPGRFSFAFGQFF